MTKHRPRSVGRPLPAALIVLVLAALAAPPGALADWADGRKQFRDAMRSPDWTVRRTAYLALQAFDQPEAVEEALGAMAKEENGAVLLAGVQTLASFRGKATQEALAAQLKGARGLKRSWVLMALRDQAGHAGSDALLALLDGNDPQAAALAALALGKKLVVPAWPRLVAGLSHKDWQVRAACARALKAFGTAAPPDVRAPLVDALEKGTGRERADCIEALEALTGQKFGWDPPAWRALVSGTPPDQIPKAPQHPAYLCGVPVFGRRVVLVYDHNLNTDDPQPFGSRERLQQLCKVPGGRDVPWFRIQTKAQFLAAHALRLVSDLPDGSYLDVVTIGGQKVKSELGKLVPLTAGARGNAERAINGVKPENGMDWIAALNLALDAGGKESLSWASGPEEVLVLACGVPWLAPVTDQNVISATIALKARARMVTIHTVGVGDHAFEAMRRLADLTGGTYLKLDK